MKLKYYLRGIGIGVIVATLIMTVSSVIHNNNLSKETIIKEAQKLGMIMPDNTEDKDSLWEKNTEEETDTAVTESETATDTQDVEDSQSVENIQNEEDTQNVENTQKEEASQNVEDTQDTTEEPVVAAITVTDSDGARRVAIKLENAGIIEDADDFHAYLKANKYERKIRSGYLRIPVGATYEEICDIIIRK